ncbi:reverse transcriptase domain-containing protein [Tanacetum coccineum]
MTNLTNKLTKFVNSNTASTLGSGTLPSNTITNPKEDLKGITTRSGVAYQGPTILTTSSSPPKVVERETEVTKDMVPHTNNGSTKDVQPPVVQVQPLVPNSEPVVAPVSASNPNPKPSIPYPSRLNNQKIREKANNQIEKFYQIFQDLHFDISFADALILMPKFASTLKSLISNKEKLFELERNPLNEHCSAVLLKKLPEKLGDPGKFLIPCDFPGMDKCLALADLGASINLMPLSVWKKLSLPKLTPTCMTLELADLVDFDADPRVPLILRRSFLKTGHALIDVYEGELTLRVGKEAVTFNLDQTLRYSANYNDMTANRIDVIDMACEEYSQEVLGFSDVIASGTPTPYYDLIVSTSSPTLTPFEDSDFLLEEVDAFLALENDPTSPKVDHSYYDSEGDILLLEALLNDDPFDFTEEKIKESKLLNDKLDHLKSSFFLPSPEYDSVFYEDFSEVDALSSTNNADKVFNPCILIHENLFEVTNCATPDKNVKKATNASLILEDFNPPLYELPLQKDVLGLGALLSFSSKNEEKVFNPGILTFKEVRTSLLLELSHRDSKAFKVIKIFESPMEIFPCSFGEDIRILDVPCLHFYPP